MERAAVNARMRRLPSSLQAGDLHAGIGLDPHGLHAREVTLDQIPHRRALDILAHARPAGDDVLLAGLDCLA